jgi:hypothetical protein
MRISKNNLLLGVIFFISTINGNGQVIDIPDTNFLNHLIFKGVDINLDGKIQKEEAELTENITINNDNVIIDFKGLEAFKNLKVFKTLSYFKVPYDFSQNKMLEELVLFNFSRMTELKVGDNPNLLSLMVFNAYQLETIDVRSSHDLGRLVVVESYNVTKIYVLDKEKAQRLGKIGLYSADIPSSVYEEPNVVLGVEKEKKIYDSSQIIQKGMQIGLDKGFIYDVRGNIVFTIDESKTFSLDHFSSGLYFLKTTKGHTYKLVFVE